MLTLDDLDHFDDRSLVGLFADAVLQDHGMAAKRREHMLACLRFCRGVPTQQLSDGGLLTARDELRGLLRSLQRGRRLQAEDLTMLLEGALESLGETGRLEGEPPAAAALRHALEGAIEAAAQSFAASPSRSPLLLDALAGGRFGLTAACRLAALEDSGGRFGSPAEIDVELALDGTDLPDGVRVRLSIASRLWRWRATEDCAIAFEGEAPMPVPGEDGVVLALVGGLALQNGRSAAAWSRALREWAATSRGNQGRSPGECHDHC